MYSSQRFSPMLWAVSSVWWWWSFPLQCSFLVSCSPICQFFLLVAEPLERYLGSYCLCLYVPVYSLLFPILVAKFQALYWSLQSTLNSYLYRVKDMNLVLVVYMQILSFPSKICWRCCLFSIVCFGPFCQKSGGNSCVHLCLGLLFHSIGLHVCFYCYGSVV
jgi:hypothetical protein